jgi:hypothetical protein
MRTYCAIDPTGRVLDSFRAPSTLVDNFVDRVVRPGHVTTPPWYTSMVIFVDVTAEPTTPTIGFFRKSNGTWLDGRPQLSADKADVAGDGVDVVTVSYTQAGPDKPSEVVFTVNGEDTHPVLLRSDAASIEITSSSPGDQVTVICGDQVIIVPVREV